MILYVVTVIVCCMYIWENTIGLNYMIASSHMYTTTDIQMDLYLYKL